MADLKTKYMGLELKNPIVAGASKLTARMDTIEQLEEAGASALVCASLFEEQIQLEKMKFDESMAFHDDADAEFSGFFPMLEHGGPSEHLMWVRKTKEAVNIPVIASLNAINEDTWIDYAKRLEDTGVDGLELNFYYTPSEMDKTAEQVETEQLEVLQALKSEIKIPITAKLSYFYSNPLNVIKKMDSLGVDAFVIFNRLFESDIDIEEEAHIKPFKMSKEGDNRLPNRFIGLLAGEVNADLIGNTGVITGADVVRAILAGANAVQVAGTLFTNEIKHLTTMLQDLESWMDKKGYATLKDFKGKLSRKNVNDPFIYRRAQYVDLILRSDELLGL